MVWIDEKAIPFCCNLFSSQQPNNSSLFYNCSVEQLGLIFCIPSCTCCNFFLLVIHKISVKTNCTNWQSDSNVQTFLWSLAQTVKRFSFLKWGYNRLKNTVVHTYLKPPLEALELFKSFLEALSQSSTCWIKWLHYSNHMHHIPLFVFASNFTTLIHLSLYP